MPHDGAVWVCYLLLADSREGDTVPTGGAVWEVSRSMILLYYAACWCRVGSLSDP